MPKKEKEPVIRIFPVWNQLEPETNPDIIKLYQEGHDRLLKKGLITSDGKLAPRKKKNERK